MEGLIMNIKTITHFLFLVCLISAVNVSRADKIPIDQVPMYGGMDRNAIPELKQGDEELIANATEEFGSRERASGKWADQGFVFYNRGQIDMAMRRFNQGWLLDPEVSDNYWGFAAVLYRNMQSCEAAKMMEIALSKKDLQPSAYADAAEIFGACVENFETIDTPKKQEYFNRIPELIKVAQDSVLVSDGYAYSKWTNALRLMKDYEGALESIKQYEEKTGDTVPDSFKDTIKNSMNDDF